MSIYEYDQEKHIRQEREEAWEEGRRSIFEKQIIKKLYKGKIIREIAQKLEMEESEIQRFIKELQKNKEVEKNCFCMVYVV